MASLSNYVSKLNFQYMYHTVQMLSNYLKLYDIWTLFENAYYKAKEPAQPAEMPYSAYIGRYTHSGAAQKKGLPS